MDVVAGGQQLRGAVGRAVVDHQHLGAIRKRPGDGPGHVVHLVIHRQGGKRSTVIPQLYAAEGRGRRAERTDEVRKRCNEDLLTPA